MGFPTSPNDGDEYTNALGTVYKYLATDDKWYIKSITEADLDHNSLGGLNDGVDYEHITQTQKNALHAEAHDLASHSTKAHQELTDYNAEANVKHLTDAQISALHAEAHDLASHSTKAHSELSDAPTSAHHIKTVSGDIALNGLSEKDHASLANKNAETDIKHLTDAQLAALHTRLHAITDILDHSASNHKILYSDGSGHIIELALGADGEVLTSTGAATAPAFEAVGGGGGSVKGTLEVGLIAGGGASVSSTRITLSSTDQWVRGSFRITDNIDATNDITIEISCAEQFYTQTPSLKVSIGVAKTDNTETFSWNILNADRQSVVSAANGRIVTLTNVLANVDIDQDDVCVIYLATYDDADVWIYDVSIKFTEAG